MPRDTLNEHTLTPRQRQALLFIQGHIAAYGVGPSLDQIARHFGLRSKTWAHYVVCALVQDGYLRRLPGRARALEVLLPVRGTVAWVPREEGLKEVAR